MRIGRLAKKLVDGLFLTFSAKMLSSVNVAEINLVNNVVIIQPNEVTKSNKTEMKE